MKDLTKAWLEAAFLDLERARRLSDDDLLTPVVVFHSQQVVEKTLKAILEELTGLVPKIHNVLKLYELVSAHQNIPCDLNVLQQINDVYIDSRYPGDLGLLPDGKPTMEKAGEFYQFVRDIHARVSDMLEHTPTENE